MTFKKLSGAAYFLFEFLILAYLSSFFLTLGSDFPDQVAVRVWAGAALTIYFAVLFAGGGIERRGHWLLGLFGIFLAFLFMRSAWAWLALSLGDKPSALKPLVSYRQFPVQWALLFIFFWISFLLCRNSYGSFKRLKWMGWAGFLIAINAVPMLLMNPRIMKEGPTILTGKYEHPLFVHEWITRYLISDFASPNYTGDLIAFGFFPALGLMTCAYFYIRGRHFQPEFKIKEPVIWLLLYGMFALVTSAAVWLFFSRGTILCFLVAALFYFLLISFKFSSGVISRFIASFIAIALAFLIWAGNFQRVIGELGTLGQEVDQEKITSFATNIEGAKRAMRIARDYPLLGVGSGNYYRVSESYATPETEETLTLANFQAMCFYLQLIAEEGMGAYLFFLFLAAFLIWSAVRLIQTRDHLRFIAGLSFLMPCFTVWMHASFNYLMQRFSMSMLVFMSMGAAMGILTKRTKSGESGEKV